MHPRTLFAAMFSAFLAVFCLKAQSQAAQSPAADDYTLSGPYTHQNLTVFLIHGPDRLKGKNYLTLSEALEQKIVIVHETGNVNELAIENVSPDQQVYIQSGDIVKGGRQDRTIAMDFIVPPKSGKMPINAFCVESGRWHQRGAESPAMFAESDNVLAGKEVKLAAKQAGDQGKVWQQVRKNQEKIASNTNAQVAAASSPSSFELSLESKPVQQHTEAYLKALQPILGSKGSDDVIGYAFAINGKINSADIYANHALFSKLWPRLLKSSAVEAVAEADGKKAADATADAVKACIADAERGKASTKDVTPRVKVVTRESEKNVVFQTFDQDAPTACVHANYVAK